MATNCTLLPGPPPTPPELMLGQREVATGHQGSVAAAGDPPGSHRGGLGARRHRNRSRRVQPGQLGCTLASGPRARLCPRLHPQARDPHARGHTPPTQLYAHSAHSEPRRELPKRQTPPAGSGPCTPRRRGPRPRPHSDPLRQLAPLSRLPTAAEETHTGPQRTSAQAHACQRGHGQGHACGSRPPGLGALQGASYFREPSLAGEGGLAWRACHRAHNTPLALGSPS